VITLSYSPILYIPLLPFPYLILAYTSNSVGGLFGLPSELTPNSLSSGFISNPLFQPSLPAT
jgi:hypothetical protein